ncbi:MAG: rod shape-determining protein MreD [Myxococcota bacterium]|nr:rod shape-determining protein MreD [Myxococcota bacterium]
MRNVAFLAVGLALLVLQANVFRAVDDIRPAVACALWVFAVTTDVLRSARAVRSVPGYARALSVFHPAWSLPAMVLLGYALLSKLAHVHIGRPIPSLVLPLILFMGVHEYSLARGAAVAFVLGYATDVLGIAPIGLYTFSYVATFVLARAAGVRLATQTTWMQVLLVGAFAIMQSTMVLVLLAIFGRDAWVPRSLYPLAFPHAIATAAVTPIVFRVSQAIHAATAGAPRAEAGGGAPS